MADKTIDARLRFRDEFTGKIKQATGHLQRHATEITKIGGRIEKSGRKMEKNGDAMSRAITVPVGAAITAAGKMYLDFEDSIANINTLLDDPSHLKGYESTIMRISNQTGLSAKDMSEGMYQAISSLGDGGKETEKIFGTMAKSAKAGGAEVKDSVALISAGMKGYNSVSDETAQKISDLAFNTAKLGVTTFPEMAKSMQPLFPLSSSLNLSYEELFGSMATLTGVTGNTAEVSTQMKAVFSNLMKPTGDMQKLIEKYGYQNGAAMIKSEGLAGTLGILQKETGGQSDQLAKLFSSTEALTAMTALTGSQYDTFNEKTKQLQNSTGATQTAFDKLKTPADRIRISINMFKNTMISFGKTVMNTAAPYIVKFSEKIQELQKWFNGLSDSGKKTVVNVLLIGAAMGPSIKIFGKLTQKVGKTYKTIGKFAKALKDAGSVSKLMESKIPSPIVKAGKKVGSAVKTMGKGAISGAKAMGKGVISAAKIMGAKTVSAVKVMGNGVVKGVKAMAKGAISAAKFMGKGIVTAMKFMISPVGIAIMAVVAIGIILYKNWDKIVAAAKKLGKRVVATFKSMVNGIKPVVSFIKTTFVKGFQFGFSLVKGYAKSLLTGIKGVVRGIKKVFNGVVDFVSGVFTGNWKKAWGGVKDIFKGIFESLTGIVKTPINAVVGMVNKVIGGINELSLDIPDWVPKWAGGGKTIGFNIPKIPMLARGTQSWIGGPAVINEAGGEIVDLPRGTRVYPHDQSVQMARKEGNGQIKINIEKLAEKIVVREDADIEKIADAVSKKIIFAMDNM